MFKRGDGVVFVRKSHTYLIGEASTERDDITVAVVTSVTRDGQIKAFRGASWGPGGAAQLMKNSMQAHALAYRLPKDEVDMVAVADYMENRPWSHSPEHTGMPFHSLDEAKSELKQFKVAA